MGLQNRDIDPASEWKLHSASQCILKPQAKKSILAKTVKNSHRRAALGAGMRDAI